MASSPLILPHEGELLQVRATAVYGRTFPSYLNRVHNSYVDTSATKLLAAYDAENASKATSIISFHTMQNIQGGCIKAQPLEAACSTTIAPHPRSHLLSTTQVRTQRVAAALCCVQRSWLYATEPGQDCRLCHQSPGCGTAARSPPCQHPVSLVL